MKEYKYTINGNIYKVRIGEIEENIAHVEVNGTNYLVEMEKNSKTCHQTAREGSPRCSHSNAEPSHCKHRQEWHQIAPARRYSQYQS